MYKCAESLQKLIELRRERGSRSQVCLTFSALSSLELNSIRVQLFEALCLLLPESSLYPVLSNLLAPDPTNPTSSNVSGIQEAIHNSLPVLQEVVSLAEKDEDETIKKEIDKRRTRLNAGSPGEAKKEVEMETLSRSRVVIFCCRSTYR